MELSDGNEEESFAEEAAKSGRMRPKKYRRGEFAIATADLSFSLAKFFSCRLLSS